MPGAEYVRNEKDMRDAEEAAYKRYENSIDGGDAVDNSHAGRVGLASVV